MKPRAKDLVDWRKMVNKIHNPKGEVKIAIVGKYFDSGDFVLSDAYISVIEAIKYSAYAQGVKPVIEWLSAKAYEEDPKKVKELSAYDGVLVPGGFGETGIEGKIRAIQYAREQKIPYFGLCYGMQLAVIEFARHVVGLKGAHTREINPSAEHLIIDVMEDQKEKIEKGNMGGTMRLGLYPARLKKGTIARNAYKSDMIMERHRHRYEVNPQYIEEIEAKGLVFSGTSPDGELMEIVELPKDTHPFFVGTQFHPEFTARPLSPHPLFTEFIKAAKVRKKAIDR